MAAEDGKDWKPATKLVRGGTMRSEFGETSEAIYLTSGYAYDSAEQAARHGRLELRVERERLGAAGHADEHGRPVPQHGRARECDGAD